MYIFQYIDLRGPREAGHILGQSHGSLPIITFLLVNWGLIGLSKTAVMVAVEETDHAHHRIGLVRRV